MLSGICPLRCLEALFFLFLQPPADKTGQPGGKKKHGARFRYRRTVTFNHISAIAQISRAVRGIIPGAGSLKKGKRQGILNGSLPVVWFPCRPVCVSPVFTCYPIPAFVGSRAVILIAAKPDRTIFDAKAENKGIFRFGGNGCQVGIRAIE